MAVPLVNLFEVPAGRDEEFLAALSSVAHEHRA